jgi:uncharacterized protein YprB with RNaseH-like and TPR domain
LLRSTFIHLPGIGPGTESALWRQGITDWSALASAALRGEISGARWALVERELSASETALRDQDVSWFARRLPESQLWRLYPTFRHRTAFLDIETTSLSPHDGIVTVVTVHGGGQTRTFVADDDLEELPAFLQRYDLLVTFNGKLFDVPFLETRFPGLRSPPAHLDLRFVLYRLGLSGGLKRIEQVLGLGDRSGVEGIYGVDAVRLWSEFRRGNPASLETLVRYNRADTVNLEPLTEYAIGELVKRTFSRNGDRSTESVPVAVP